MPASMSAKVSANVKALYSCQSAMAVLRSWGVSFSSVGPAASAKKSSRPPTASRGSTAMNSAMTPRPPSHCVRARQKNIPRPSAPKSVRIVAPVVVRPDIDSNRASTNGNPAAMYGIAERCAITSHVAETMASPSMRRNMLTSSAPVPPARRIARPSPAVAANVRTKTTPSRHSRCSAATPAGRSNAGAKRATSVPTVWTTMEPRTPTPSRR